PDLVIQPHSCNNGVEIWVLVLLTLSFASDIQARHVPNHMSSVCSNWGRGHFKTFDGDVYQFPGRCEYNLVHDCRDPYPKFSVNMKRTETEISYVVVIVNEVSFHLKKSVVTKGNMPVTLPYYNQGVQVREDSVYTRLRSKVGFTVMWNREDAVMVILDNEFANRTCGLCGDFNGVPIHNEFIYNGHQMSSIEFGNKHQVHNINDVCHPYEEEDEDKSPKALNVTDLCKEFQTTCNQMMLSDSWSSCIKLIDPEPYIQACVQDMCGCTNKSNDFCVCSTLSEFSRQCSHAGGQPPSWRTPKFCAKQCPVSMVYEESGSPCMDTCLFPDASLGCEHHNVDGCFCPKGTVFDDISKKGCVPQTDCQCKHGERIYNSGEVYQQEGKNCTCFEGRWICESFQVSATCAVEEGSHITTFDGNIYTFHGNCYYTLATVNLKNDTHPKFIILAELVPCADQEFDTCLKSLKIVLNSDTNNALMFTSDGAVKQGVQTLALPHYSGNISIVNVTSFHIFLQTNFGLRIQVQHVPVMQVYITLEQSYSATTRGLCGNYNNILCDDMKTPQGIVEGTATTFSNSWKASDTCKDSVERLIDPCSLKVDSEKYIKEWCGLLQSKNSTFAPCHSAVDPESYYKRCTYASCTCEKTKACLCAVFFSYARACATKRVFLKGWGENVCETYTKSCPASQTFFYSHRCQLTCRSLSSNKQSCTSDFLPVDGCSCAKGHYLNENGICVPKAKCSCYYNGDYIQPGESTKDKQCVCSHGAVHCHSQVFTRRY
ncbi:LOW QUALITY PROTEIN: mucin-2, partial [Parambassis ranga]|uniref:LOW QUALITY PROTEIN: mucin-2 n=1 Tax=Parambassis ranga TaxID=210632 RepID=A0A6P7K9Z8_9TELE